MYNDCTRTLFWIGCWRWLLKLNFKNKNGTIPLHFYNILVAETVPVDPQRYNFRHKRRVIIPITPRECQKCNTITTNLDSWYFQQTRCTQGVRVFFSSAKMQSSNSARMNKPNFTTKKIVYCTHDRVRNCCSWQC